MKKITIYILTALFIVSLAGCEDWLDVNQNPNDLTISTPELVFNGAAKQYGERQLLGSGFSLLGAWTGYFAHCGGWSGWNNVKSYNMTSSDYTGFWGPYTGDLKNLGYVESKAREEGNLGLVGAAKILKVGTFERIVDTYGDVPYFEAALGMSGNTTPVYDDAQAIYEDLVIQLDSAVYYLNEAITAHTDIDGSKDPIMGGDKEDWIRYANAIKLRLLVKQSDITGRSGYIDANWSFDPLGFPVEVVENPGYLEGTSGKMNPLFEGYYQTYQGLWSSANTQYGLNVFLKNLYDQANDPRIRMCWKPGATSSDYSHGLQLGLNGAPEDHWGGVAGEAIRIGAGIAGESTDPVQVMSEVEINFLFAEAVARGRTVPGVSGTARELWEDAIESSFYYYGQRAGWTNGNISDTLAFYMGQISTNTTLGWDDANPIKSIMYQKYLGGVGLYHFQTWTDLRRSGYPVPEDPTLVDYSMISYYFNIVRAQVPVRMLYVQDELDLNGINVNAAIDKTGVPYNSEFIMDARIFWDVN
jgi:hypothetical protein